MSSMNYVMLIIISVILLFLTAVGGYAFSQVWLLSLPISRIFAGLTIMLPLFNGLSTIVTERFLRSPVAGIRKTRPLLYLLSLFAFQLIYETVIVTLSTTYIIPTASLNCGLDEQWKLLWRNKDGTSIRRIQDRFDCCGYNSVVDRAWPFPSGPPGTGIDVDECARRFARDRPCAQPWRQAEHTNAGLFLTVGLVVFLTKLVSLIIFFNTSNTASQTPGFQSRSLNRLGTGEDEAGRRLIDEGQQQEHYHDEPGSTRGTESENDHRNGNGNRPRVEPSGLLHAGEAWRDEERVIEDS